MPVAWETLVPFWDHTEINHINILALFLWLEAPFNDVEMLPKDNGERFFSAYLQERNEIVASIREHPLNSQCQCLRCTNNPIRLTGNNSIMQTLVFNPKPPPQTQPPPSHRRCHHPSRRRHHGHHPSRRRRGHHHNNHLIFGRHRHHHNRRNNNILTSGQTIVITSHRHHREPNLACRESSAARDLPCTVKTLLDAHHMTSNVQTKKSRSEKTFKNDDDNTHHDLSMKNKRKQKKN